MDSDGQCNDHIRSISQLQNCAEKLEEYTSQIRQLINEMPAPSNAGTEEEHNARAEMYREKQNAINGILAKMESCKK